MLPSKGFFSNLNCPYFECGSCDRPHCHFKHSKKDKDVNSSENEATGEVSYEKNETLIKQLVNETVKQVLTQQECKDATKEDKLLDTTLILDNVVSSLRNNNPKNNNKELTSTEPITEAQLISKVSYKPTPISELTKRHIPVQYAPTRPNHLMAPRKTPSLNVTYTPSIKTVDGQTNTTSLNQYEPSLISSKAHVSHVTYAPTKLSETKKCDSADSSDDYKPTNLYENFERSNSPLTYIPTQINKELTKQPFEQIKLKSTSTASQPEKKPSTTKAVKSTELHETNDKETFKKSKTLDNKRTASTEDNHHKKHKEKRRPAENHKDRRESNRLHHEHHKSDKHSKYIKHKTDNKISKVERKKSHDQRHLNKEDKKGRVTDNKMKTSVKSKMNSTDDEAIAETSSSSDVELVLDKQTCIVINDTSSSSSSDQISEFNSSGLEDGRISPQPKKRKLSVSGGSLPLLQNPNPVSPPSTLCERWRKARQQVQKSNLTGKLRISSVPNVLSLLNAKDRLLSMAQKPVPPNKKHADEEEVKPHIKRIAHKPTTLDYPKCVLDPEIKLPLSVRQVCLNTMYETYAQFCSPDDAKKNAISTELMVAKRVHLTKTYQNSMAIAVLRIRRNKGEIKDLVEPNESELETGTTAQSVPDFTYGLSLYECFLQYVISEKEYTENGFPMPHPTRKGCAYIQKTARRATVKQPDDPNQRICANCSNQYFVDDSGFPVTENDCFYHWGRLYKFRAANMLQEKYRCCNSEAGSEPCVNARYHVSSIINEDCLEGFVTTSGMSAEPQVYALDCEMCYTKIGLELTRCTMISLDGKIVLDTTVLPSSPILDYCTRFSGITESIIKQCKTTFSQFREQLLSLVKKNTIVVGHSLENDFKVMKVIHKAVVDTSVIFPHKLGLPYKVALRNLVKDKLSLSIQDKESGHDSKEDADACLKLMIRKIKEDAKKRKPRVIISIDK
uniref:Exonuclease domain-containing protein n=1 Tax=Rhodnius prolixus TaxID=13249 RepID=A0A905QX24_RHOPR